MLARAGGVEGEPPIGRESPAIDGIDVRLDDECVSPGCHDVGSYGWWTPLLPVPASLYGALFKGVLFGKSVENTTSVRFFQLDQPEPSGTSPPLVW